MGFLKRPSGYANVCGKSGNNVRLAPYGTGFAPQTRKLRETGPRVRARARCLLADRVARIGWCIDGYRDELPTNCSRDV